MNDRADIKPSFVKVPMWVMWDERLSAKALIVFVHILSYMNKERQAWPNIGTLQRVARVSRSVVIRSVKELEELKLIECQRTSGKGNVYKIAEFSDVYVDHEVDSDGEFASFDFKPWYEKSIKSMGLDDRLDNSLSDVACPAEKSRAAESRRKKAMDLDWEIIGPKKVRKVDKLAKCN